MRLILMAVLLLLPPVLSAGPQLTPREYKALMQVSELLESARYQEARQTLLEAQGKASSDYAKALISHNLGQVEIQRERYPQALKHVKSAYSLKALPEEQQTNLLRTLAQLHCMQEAWKACVKHLSQWMKQQPDAVKGEDHLLLAQAYSQLEQWRNTLTPISRAIATRKVAPQSWYQLKVVAHIRLKQWRSAVKTQKKLVTHYAANTGHWRQLVSLHLQAGERRAALHTQRMGYERGLLTSASDHRLLAQMMLEAKMPFFAGQVVESGLKTGVLKHNKRNLTLLSHAWMLAKEKKQAVAALTSLNKVAPSTKTMTQLAHVQLELQDWQAAHDTLRKTLKRSKDKQQPRLQLLLGITRIKLQRYDQARLALRAASADKRLQPEAQGWIRYLDQISPAHVLADAR